MKNHTVAIIGGGPGGYVTAIRLKQYEIDVVVFEKERLGGICLNWGCIPTKTLVKIADLFTETKHAYDFGISIENLNINYEKIFKRKNEIVDRLVSGVEFLFKKRDIPVIYETVTGIKKNDEDYTIITENSSINAKYIILATGSIPKELPSLEFDGENILSSKDILKMKKLPEKLAVIGGGVIGCEFASIFSQLDVKVEIIEFLPNLVSTEDIEISKRLALALIKSGIKIHLNTAVDSVEKINDELHIKLSNGKKIITNKALISVGRTPHCNIEFIKCSLEKEDTTIKIDNNFKTNLHNIFAIGDITGKMLLAHTASKQGLIVADILQNKIKGTDNKIEELLYENIPRCTYTNPEIGSVGLTEARAKEKYGEILIGKSLFLANGKALGLGNTFGFVKTIADKLSKKIVGMHIIGPHATELIAEGVILINNDMTIEKAVKIVYAHPTLSEVVAESIEDLEKLAIHKI
ncbi:MAG: dihydrolipoyl dehydrogenase [Candidatus Cloacimonetes bacterium]|nr:dihydrolipoyl dehydrogenase [Candidatus Cloacimonadota bacterium]